MTLPRPSCSPLAMQTGATLIEVVISIVIVAVAVTTVLGVLSRNVERSADVMAVTQAVAIAEAYLEEITLKSFDDPDGIDGEGARALFDDTDDYDGLADSGAVDQFGNPIAALAAYQVSVAVTPSAALPSVAAADAFRVDVRVQLPPLVDYTLTGYRTRL